MPQTILVTGGAGFIGANLVHYLARRNPDDRIIVLDLLTYAGSIESLPPGFRFMEDAPRTFWHGDICNASLVQTLVDQSDVVIHLAAETHVTRSIFDNHTFFQTDVMGTHTVLSALLKCRDTVKRLIHISTSEVYGTSLHDRMDEDHPLNPQSPYAAAKCAADRLVYSYVKTYELPAVIVRPFNNYGPRQHLEKLVPRFITSAILDEPMTVHGDGRSARDFIHVDDTCTAIVALMEAPEHLVLGEAFNLASGTARPVIDIAADVARLAGREQAMVQRVEERPGQVSRHCGDATKIRERIGWVPSVDWDAGLAASYGWYVENSGWWSRQLPFRSVPIMTAKGELTRH